jgi:putative ubiquitin-RnfH superfamily antitoxin RatB of RatAB toxin-antitoxin module
MADLLALRVTVVFSPVARETREWSVVVPQGSTVLDTIKQTTVAQEFPQLEVESMNLGVWGRRCATEQAVRDGDRVELYRPLQVDPKIARRERFRKQGSRVAGLFARKP